MRITPSSPEMAKKVAKQDTNRIMSAGAPGRIYFKFAYFYLWANGIMNWGSRLGEDQAWYKSSLELWSPTLADYILSVDILMYVYMYICRTASFQIWCIFNVDSIEAGLHSSKPDLFQIRYQFSVELYSRTETTSPGRRYSHIYNELYEYIHMYICI